MLHNFFLNPFLESVADRIRERAQSLVELEPVDLEPDLKNIYGRSEGQELFIVNQLYKAKGFRKIHLETASFASSLEIFHCVFFPEPTFDLPIFGVDLVAVPNLISAAIVDLSPVDKVLPLMIEQKLRALTFPSFKKERRLPDWGDIFSPYVQFISPVDAFENNCFLELVDQFLIILLSNSKSMTPEPVNSSSSIARFKGQEYYCLQQKKNDKTRNVLAKTFGSHWATKYIEKVLFDLPSSFD